MATAREDLVTGEDKLALLEEMLEILKRNQQSINVMVATTCNNSVGNCFFVTITTTGVSGCGEP